MDAGGIPMIVSLVVNSHTENLLDLDQSDEIQSNASEILANATRYNFERIAELFDQHVINTIVYMVASTNKHVRRHAPLVLGNISQTAECRVRIGDAGGIEALFLAVEDKDPAVQANALWAMCNLMWHPSNQERAGRFMQEIINAMNAEWAPVKGHAALLLSNVLYYNTPNRTRLLEIEGSMDLLLRYVRDRSDKLIMEGCLRAILSMSYVDEVAIWLGSKEDGNAIPLLISLLQEPVVSHEVVRYSLETLCNLCVHHSNRTTILDNYGIESCMNLLRDTDPHIVEVANQIVGHLEDITPKEVLAAAKSKFSIDALVTLSTADDPLVRALVAEALGEEVWLDASKQKVLNKLGGIPALLRICSRPDESITAVLPALWSLRNLLYKNPEGQNQFYDNNGMIIISEVMGKCFLGAYAESSDKVMESCLGCAVNALVNHERNARRLLVAGLDHILDLAEGKSAARNAYRIQSSHLIPVFASESIPALAKNILEMLGPYNYVVCRNCGKKQQLSGNNCILCGRILLMDSATDATASPKKSSFKDKKFRIDAVAKAYHYH
jgi:HEAT repeat protein